MVPLTDGPIAILAPTVPVAPTVALVRPAAFQRAQACCCACLNRSGPSRSGRFQLSQTNVRRGRALAAPGPSRWRGLAHDRRRARAAPKFGRELRSIGVAAICIAVPSSSPTDVAPVMVTTAGQPTSKPPTSTLRTLRSCSTFRSERFFPRTSTRQRASCTAQSSTERNTPSTSWPTIPRSGRGGTRGVASTTTSTGSSSSPSLKIATTRRCGCSAGSERSWEGVHRLTPVHTMSSFAKI